MKKTLVVLLTLMMVFAFASTALAADTQYVPYTDIADEDSDTQTAIERLSVLGALKGYNAEGTIYAPDNLITREEFATIGVRIAGLEDQVALYASLASAFKDVEEGRWSEGYINCANANGIMVGRGAGLFDPKANVTMQEVATVLLRAVGYTDQLPGPWPTDYNRKAVNVGLTEYVDYIGPKYASRGEVAALVNEAVDLSIVFYVDNEFAQGIGLIGWDDADYVDEDGFAYKVFKTNEEDEDDFSDLLYQTFGAYVTTAQFEDMNEWDDAIWSEISGWGFDDFTDWELLMYFRPQVELDWDEERAVEVAGLYGISDGCDLTDLGFMRADLTIYDKGQSKAGKWMGDEICYVDFTSTFERMTQADDEYDLDWGNVLPDEGYGEVWFDADDDAYAAKDFADFEKWVFGVVDSADAEEVIMKADCPGLYDIDVENPAEDGVVFYLLGQGFVDAADLQENDVVWYPEDGYNPVSQAYKDSVVVYLVSRPVAGVLDDYGTDFIEVDDVDYGAVYEEIPGPHNDYYNSFYSVDEGDSVDEYDEDVVFEVEFSDSIIWAPAYAFINFAYFVDDMRLYQYGILDSYVFDNAAAKQRLNPNLNYDIVTGMNVLLPGDDELTTFTFTDSARVHEPDASWDEDDLAEVFPEEGSLVEFVLNNEGECVDWRYCDEGSFDFAITQARPEPCYCGKILGHSWNKISWFDWDDGIMEPELCCSNHDDLNPNHGYAVGEWSTKGRLDLTLYQGPWSEPDNDVYKFAEDAVIFLVDSTGSSSNAYPDAPYVYDFDSAQCLSYDDFKALGDFTARDLCIYSHNGTTIDILYVCDFEANDEEAYGFGLYTGKAARSVSLDAYYVVIGNQVVIVAEEVFEALEDRTAGLVAYKTSDGEVEDHHDFLLINRNNHQGDIYDYYHDGWYDELEYVIGCGDVKSFDDNEFDLWYFHDYLLDEDLGARTLFSDDFIEGYNYLAEDLVDITTLDDDLEEFSDPHAIVVLKDDDNNDLLYLLLFNDNTPN